MISLWRTQFKQRKAPEILRSNKRGDESDYNNYHLTIFYITFFVSNPIRDLRL